MWWVKLFGPIVGALGSLFFVWKRIKKLYPALKNYYRIVWILLDAIEMIEKSTGVVPDQAYAISKTVKGFVWRSLSKEDREKLDELLKVKGYKE